MSLISSAIFKMTSISTNEIASLRFPGKILFKRNWPLVISSFGH